MRAEFCADSFWDANVWEYQAPVLTKCFTNSVLVYLPATFVLLGGLIHFHVHRKRSQNPLPVTILHVAKSIISGAQISLYLSAAYYALTSSSSNLSDFIAHVLRTLSLVMILAVQSTSRRLRVSSSALLTVYWLLTMLCEIPTYYRYLLAAFRPTRSEFALPESFDFAIVTVAYPLVFAQFVLDAFTEKFSVYDMEKERRHPMYYSSTLSRIFFEFFSTLVYSGYRRLLSLKDLPPLLDSMDSSTSYHEWKHTDNTYKASGKRIGLVGTLFKTYWPQLVLVWTLETMYVSFRISSFIALNELILYLGEPDAPAWKGYMFVLMIFAVYSVSSTMMRWADFFLLSLGVKIKSLLIAAIVRKSLRVDGSHLEKFTVGELVNLLSVDADKIHQFSNYVGNLIGCPFYVGLCTWMLWRFIGPSCLAGISMILIMMPITAAVAGQSRKVQAKQMALKDSRLKYIGELLSSMKIVKFYGWEPPFVDRILNVRKQENAQLKKFAYWTAVLRFFWSISPFLVSLFAFITYLYVNDLTKIDANIAFVSLGLFNSMRFPLAQIPDVISNAVQSLVSVRRIESFLNAKDLEDYVVGDRPGSGNAARWRDACLGWTKKDSEPVLENVDLSVKVGDLVAIVGEVGSGKSSLLNSLLGNLRLVGGAIDISGTVGYVPQQAWIQNATIKQNILFTKQYDKQLYKRVIRKCCLTTDLRMLPGGDETEIGEKGINLSGGQKQRVSLARAVYMDRDVYLLDDPLSAVDAQVGASLFHNVIGNSGMLRNKTRILVTNMISVLPNVDRIVVLKNGRVIEHGTYEQLKGSSGEFAKLLNEHTATISQQDAEPQQELEASSGSVGRSSSISSSTSAQNSKSDRQNLLISEELMQSGSVKLSVYTEYLSKMGVFFCLITALGFASARAFDVLSGLWLSAWSNDVPGNVTERYVQRTERILGYAAMGVSYGVLTFVGAACLATGTLTAARKLHNDMLNAIARAPMSFLDTTPLGRLLNRFGKDVDQLDIQLPVAANIFLDMFFQLAGVIVLISINVPLFLLVSTPLLVGFMIVQRVYMKSIRQIKRMEAVSRSPVFNHFAEMLDGLASIRAYCAEDYFVSKSDSNVDITQNCSFLLSVGKLWLRTRLDFIANFLILAASVLVVQQKGLMDANVAGFVVSYAMGAAFAFNMIVHVASEVEASIVASERIGEYVVVEPEAPFTTDCVPDSDWPSRGSITFDKYSTRYRDGLDLVLKQISLEIRPGEKIGVVGRTGAGKSSLTLSLFRIIEAAEGRLLIDGIDVSKLGLHDLRPRLTIIPQDPVIFSGTLRVNLDPNDEHSDEQLWNALEKAHVKKPFAVEGLATGIAGGGSNLSVGQRQLICLARAILQKKKILVLDEATAAVDVETDALIQKTIRADFSDCTIITIAHRLNTILDSDLVVVMDAGKVVEQGSPQALLNDPASRFYDMALEAGFVDDRKLLLINR